MIEHGPSSKKRPVVELHPGPPLSQIIRGAVDGVFRDSKHQKKRCLEEEMSRYPECCLTVGSQRLEWPDWVTRSW
jgi:hypothetical protein